jgi:hypothetical protein
METDNDPPSSLPSLSTSPPRTRKPHRGSSQETIISNPATRKIQSSQPPTPDVADPISRSTSADGAPLHPPSSANHLALLDSQHKATPPKQQQHIEPRSTIYDSDSPAVGAQPPSHATISGTPNQFPRPTTSANSQINSISTIITRAIPTIPHMDDTPSSSNERKRDLKVMEDGDLPSSSGRSQLNKRPSSQTSERERRRSSSVTRHSGVSRK